MSRQPNHRVVVMSVVYKGAIAFLFLFVISILLNLTWLIHLSSFKVSRKTNFTADETSGRINIRSFITEVPVKITRCTQAQYSLIPDNRFFPRSDSVADCPKLFKRTSHLRTGLIHGLKAPDKIQSDRDFFKNLTNNCSETYRDFKDAFYVSEFEEKFPIAFEMLTYYKPLRIQQYIRLLRNIYRPQNVYCIHIDKKSPEWWTNLFKEFAECFPNVFIAKNPVSVLYASSGILYAHLRCFDELLERDLDWKYVISLHGTELPLVTNKEIVRKLKQMNGSNVIPRGVNASDKHSAYHQWISHKVVKHGNGVSLSKEKVHVPKNITIFKSASSANSAITKQMVQFMLKDQRAIELGKFLKDAKSAVEFFFSTINNLEDAPGGFNTFSKKIKMPLIAQRDWLRKGDKISYGFCGGGHVVHNICIVSAYDLPRLRNASQHATWWFHNKYFIEYDRTVIDCMEDLLLQRNRMEYEKDCSNYL